MIGWRGSRTRRATRSSASFRWSTSWPTPVACAASSSTAKKTNSHIQLTVDYPEDLAAANELYDVLYQPGQAFTFARLLDVLRAQPRLLQRFSKAARNEEYWTKRQRHAGTSSR